MARRLKQAEGVYGRKAREAAHLLFFKHHRLPGVRGWELRQELGPDWLEVLDVLDSQIKAMDLQVTRVFDEPDVYAEPTSAQLADARFYITLRSGVEQRAAKTIGWRIDDIAGLAVAVAYLISKQGKAPRGDVEKVLTEKLPGWKVKFNVDNYIEEGYLGSDESGVLFLDWRSRAEIDQKQLIDLVLGFGKKAGDVTKIEAKED